MRRAQIVVLALALGAGGAAVLFMSRIEQPSAPPPAPPKIATVEILVAKADIEAGLKLAPDKVQWQEWPEAAVNPEYVRKTDSPAAMAEIAASIARTTFSPGEPILRTKLIGPNGSGYMAALIRRGMRAVSMEITSEAGVSGFILPNDRVDVVLTRVDKTATGKNEGKSETILANVRVLAIDQTAEEKNGQRVVIGKTATLEVTYIQAETITLARRLGTLSLTLRSLRDAEVSGDDNESLTDILNAPESITIVRGAIGDMERMPVSKGRRQAFREPVAQASGAGGAR
jgi:pilus assembly protein CpaB